MEVVTINYQSQRNFVCQPLNFTSNCFNQVGRKCLVVSQEQRTFLFLSCQLNQKLWNSHRIRIKMWSKQRSLSAGYISSEPSSWVYWYQGNCPNLSTFQCSISLMINCHWHSSPWTSMTNGNHWHYLRKGSLRKE